MAAAIFNLFMANCNINNNIRLALIDQGFDTCDTLLDLPDHEVRNLIRRMITPGGTQQGRGFAAGRANRGTQVSVMAENNLRRACYYVIYLHRIQRPFVVLEATLARVREVWDDRFDVENPHKDAPREDVKDPTPMVKVDDIKKTIEDIENALKKRRGVKGSPLSYVTRTNPDLPENTPGEVDHIVACPPEVVLSRDRYFCSSVSSPSCKASALLCTSWGDHPLY